MVRSLCGSCNHASFPRHFFKLRRFSLRGQATFYCSRDPWNSWRWFFLHLKSSQQAHQHWRKQVKSVSSFASLIIPMHNHYCWVLYDSVSSLWINSCHALEPMWCQARPVKRFPLIELHGNAATWLLSFRFSMKSPNIFLFFIDYLSIISSSFPIIRLLLSYAYSFLILLLINLSFLPLIRYPLFRYTPR